MGKQPTIAAVGSGVPDDRADTDLSTDRPTTILRKPSVLARLGISDTSLWRMTRAGKFPRPVQLTPGTVGWLEREVEAWLAARAAERQ